MTTRQKLLGQKFIKELPYSEFLRADAIIQKGADAALLYFWFNLIKGHYRQLFSVEKVQKQVVFFCNRNPEFEGDIINWFNEYIDKFINHHADNKTKIPA